MLKIGITGSLASGKSTVAKILSRGKYPLFSADKVVKELYSNKKLIKKITKIFNLKKKNFKKQIKATILKDISQLKKLELLIHPLVRKNMKAFTEKNKKKKLLVYEIPLLVESKLMRNFNLVWFVSKKKKIRLKRYIKRKGKKEKTTFLMLDKRQINQKRKMKYSDKIIYNNYSIEKLKKNVKLLVSKYE